MDYNFDLYKDENGIDRFVRLRTPDAPRTYPYQKEPSGIHYPYVGEVSGAAVKITRDEANKLTLYEVSLPLSEIGLSIDTMENFRWGYVQSTDEGLGQLEYSLAAGTFGFRCGTDSFMPNWPLFYPLFTRLGVGGE